MRSRHIAVISAVALAAMLGATDVDAQSTPKVARNPTALEERRGDQGHEALRRARGAVPRELGGRQQRQDLADKDAGKVEDLLLDHNGRVGYAVVSFGGFLGIGDKLFAVPWDAVVVDREKRTVYVDVKKETLERSPSFTADKYPDPNDRAWGREVPEGLGRRDDHGRSEDESLPGRPRHVVGVNVDTTNGTVQLNGTVDTDKTRQRATELARQVEGVRRVVNNLKVQG